MRFVDLIVSEYAGATVLVDIDGTLMADKSERMEHIIEEKLRALAAVADVYLASNGKGARTKRLAEEMGIGFLPRLRKPLSHAAIQMLERKVRTVVIGDKFLTDRLLALRLGAEFVQVDRLRAETDTRRTRFAYALDDRAAFVAAAVALIRPHQWVKNLLVFAPLFFAGALFVPGAFAASLAAFIAFCVAASCTYIFNDLLDREQDRLHPKKRNRPLASGRIQSAAAITMIALLAAIEMALIAAYPSIALVMSAYILLNILYSVWLKHVAVVDVLCVAIFYILRLEVGSVATNIPLSPWIILCVFFVSLFVIIGKRRAEFAHDARRRVLESYTKPALDAMLTLSAGLALISYALYTVIGHPGSGLLFSLVFVALALLRVLNDIYSEHSHAESPEKLLFKDPWIFGSFVAWGLYVFIAFYAI